MLREGMIRAQGEIGQRVARAEILIRRGERGRARFLANCRPGAVRREAEHRKAKP